MNETKEHINLT